MIICGIDYSLTSPSICVHKGKEWSHKNCTFYYMTKKDKNVVIDGQFKGSLYEEYNNDTHRYDNLSRWSLGIIEEHKVEHASLEGYAFGAVGRVFQIAENTGLLKYNIWKRGIPLSVFAPSMIKKHATGKGNAKKDMLYESFVSETGLDIFGELAIKNRNNWNPVSDIVDAYYIAKLGHMQLTSES